MSSQLIDTEIVQIEAARTQFNGSMWKCKTTSGTPVNIFASDDPRRDSARLFANAGYTDSLVSEPGIVVTWKRHPIKVTLQANGQYWNVIDVSPRPPDAEPDPTYKPDPDYHRRRAMLYAKELLVLKGARWIDVETTGLDLTAEIVSIAILDEYGSELMACYVQPANIDEAAATQNFHHITPDQLRHAPRWLDPYDRRRTLYESIRMHLYGQHWIAYNAPFDSQMIDIATERHELAPIIPGSIHDAMLIYAEYVGIWQPAKKCFKPFKLAEAAESMAIPVEVSHNALSDVQTTYQLIARIEAGERVYPVSEKE